MLRIGLWNKYSQFQSNIYFIAYEIIPCLSLVEFHKIYKEWIPLASISIMLENNGLQVFNHYNWQIQKKCNVIFLVHNKKVCQLFCSYQILDHFVSIILLFEFFFATISIVSTHINFLCIRIHFLSIRTSTLFSRMTMPQLTKTTYTLSKKFYVILIV